MSQPIEPEVPGAVEADQGDEERSRTDALRASKERCRCNRDADELEPGAEATESVRIPIRDRALEVPAR